MELLICIVLAIVVVIIVQFIGLVVFYQLLTKNINEQIMRKTEYLEACFLEKLSATNVHTVACSTYPEPTTKCGTNPKTTRHDESVPDMTAPSSVPPSVVTDKEQEFWDEEISSDSPDDVGCGLQYLSSDVVKDCPMSFEYTLEEATESLTSNTSSIPFRQDVDSISRIINDELGGKNGFKNITLNTKTERHCHFHGDVKALAIGDKNTLNNIDKFNIDKHQIKGKQRRGKQHKRGNRKKRTIPDMKRGHNIKDPRSNEGGVNQAQQGEEQCDPYNCNEGSAVPQCACMKGPYTKKTGLDYLKNKDDSLAIENENNMGFDVCSKDHPEGIQHIIKSALCRETGGDRRLADILDIKAASCHDRYSFEPGTNTRVREDASNVKPNQTNVHESCNKNMINYYLNNDGGNSKMFVNDIPKDEHYQVCRSCKFLAKVAEKLKKTGTRYTDITKEELYVNGRIDD